MPPAKKKEAVEQEAVEQVVDQASVFAVFSGALGRVWDPGELAAEAGCSSERAVDLMDAWLAAGVAQKALVDEDGATVEWAYVGRGPGLG